MVLLENHAPRPTYPPGASIVKPSALPTWIVLLSLLPSLAADWPRFRGPHAEGVVAEANVPVRWSATENVVWKTAMPGSGASSPIIIGEKIFLTAYSGYGQDLENPGEIENLRLHILCVGADDGKILWEKSAPARMPEQEYRGFTALHGYASNTPTSDGKNVYAFFGHSGVYALSIQGDFLWLADVGRKTHSWSSGASPILYQNLLIVTASVESDSLVALDKATGKEVWRAEGIDDAWGTPLIVELSDGKTELVVSMKNKVLGFDPMTGKQLWECAGVEDYICPSVIAHDGIAYITAGRKPHSLAVRCGGRGDVTDSHILWELRKTSKVPTPVYHEGLLYWVGVKGVAMCIDAKTGELVYQERIPMKGQGDKVYASMVMAGGRLYAVSRSDGTFVLAPGREFKQLAHNDLGDRSIFNATPAIHGNRLILRSDKYLYCLGK